MMRYFVCGMGTLVTVAFELLLESMHFVVTKSVVFLLLWFSSVSRSVQLDVVELLKQVLQWTPLYKPGLNKALIQAAKVGSVGCIKVTSVALCILCLSNWVLRV